MKNPLIPIDGSPSALRALALATDAVRGQADGQVHVLNVQAPMLHTWPGKLVSPDMVAERGLIEDSVLLGAAVMGRGVTLRGVIVDESCVIPDGFKAGAHSAEDRANFHFTERGVALITPEMLGQQVHRVG